MAGMELFAIVGFLLASYSIVANDAIQTLGTFLSSNSRAPWWVLWLFACGILVAVMGYGWFTLNGDISFERLNRISYPPIIANDGSRPDWWARWDPPGGIEWYHVLPPLVLLFLTRWGIPVSTTFLVLTIFTLTGGADGAGVLPGMLTKSFVGYVVAFALGLVIYLLVSRIFERWVWRTKQSASHWIWTVLQWCSTGFLWSQWLMQDLANIFVFLPRHSADQAATAGVFDPTVVILGTAVMLVLHAVIFATRGGEIQKIVMTKTNTIDIRSATVIDLIYGVLLYVFKELNDLPMSTTWVFLGLLAGRELAITVLLREARTVSAAIFDVVSDIMRALIGLFVSVFLAIAIPKMAGAQTAIDVGWPMMAGLVAATFVCFGVIWMLRGRSAEANVIQPAE
ncbi:MAG: hypothetical protein R3C52_03720 [Hyphomonadaceae bacterium]